MTVWVNGNKQILPDGTTLSELIRHLHLNEKSVAVELNRKVVDKYSYSTTRASENDTLEIVHFVGGG